MMRYRILVMALLLQFALPSSGWPFWENCPGPGCPADKDSRAWSSEKERFREKVEKDEREKRYLEEKEREVHKKVEKDEREKRYLGEKERMRDKY